MLDYYSPGSIVYSRSQIIWLLLYVAGRDSWPSRHKETGYTGDIQTSRSHHAYYEETKMIMGELGGRLKTCGEAGLWLCYMVKTGDGDDRGAIFEIASILGMNPDIVQWNVNTAFNYCKGVSRKKLSYRQYVTHRKWYERQGVVN